MARVVSGLGVAGGGAGAGGVALGGAEGEVLVSHVGVVLLGV